MLKWIITTTKQTSIFIILFTIITGCLYPSAITLLGRLLFQQKRDGCLLYRDDVIVGSELIGQNFTADKYFWGRPSASIGYPYNAMYSAGSNFGVRNAEYLAIVKQRIARIKKTHSDDNKLLPLDLITASASGLDPHISILGAYYQIQRIAKARKISVLEISDLIERNAIKSIIPFLGESRVNVLLLNLGLDKISVDYGSRLNGQSENKS